MAVELRQQTGINLATKREQKFEQYMVFDGPPDSMEWVGIIGWKKGSKLIFVAPVDPIRQQRIKDQVELQLERKADTVSYPDIDHDLVLPPEENPYDEFNESDLI